MFLQICLLIIGFVLLIKGADVFVDGASSTAQNFKVPKMLIGLTIVAFGTSAPELAVSIQALASRSSDMVLGNVIGSNITNILLILGVAATICPIIIKDNTVKKELPLCIMISLLLASQIADKLLDKSSINMVTRSDALAIILVFGVFLYYIVTLAVKDRKNVKEVEEPKFGLFKSIAFVLFGLAGIVVGSNLVVNSASSIARFLGWSERLISLTIIAFGTSLPELVTTIISSLKNEQDILVGNIIGSNIFNICIVLGVPVAIFGGIPANNFTGMDLIFFILSAIMLYIFSKTKRKITRSNGIVLLLLFAVYYTIIFVL
ncbi:MAG: calcium/sodium antiporter [Bacilli bacterium]|nr:calcium/sodium antiporter [Bacilli bacterium]